MEIFRLGPSLFSLICSLLLKYLSQLNLHRVQCILYFTVYFRITASRVELFFRIVPAVVLDAILNKNVGIISVFLLQILHLGCTYIIQVLACTKCWFGIRISIISFSYVLLEIF